MTNSGTTKHRVRGEKTEAGSSSTISGEYDSREYGCGHVGKNLRLEFDYNQL